MSKIKGWLILLASILAVLFGVKTAYEKRLAKERKRATEQSERALKAGDRAGSARAAQHAALAELRLNDERKKPIKSRAAELVAESRTRQSAKRAGRHSGGVGR